MRRVSSLVVALAITLYAPIAAQHGGEQRDMALVGHDDLQARSAYNRRSTTRETVGSPTSAITAV